MSVTSNAQRLSSLVSQDLYGAELLAHMEVENLATETHYIVMWKRQVVWGTEYGTHRAVLSADHGILIWGHYVRSQRAARRSYDSRIALSL